MCQCGDNVKVSLLVWHTRYTDTFCNAVNCRFELTLKVQMWTRARSECLPEGGKSYSYATVHSVQVPCVVHLLGRHILELGGNNAIIGERNHWCCCIHYVWRFFLLWTYFVWSWRAFCNVFLPRDAVLVQCMLSSVHHMWWHADIVLKQLDGLLLFSLESSC